MIQFVTETSIDDAERLALAIIADFIGIKDVFSKGNQQLYDEILLSDTTLKDPLINYMAAYEKLFEYSKKLENKLKKDKQAVITETEEGKFQAFVRDKFDARISLQQQFEALQLKRDNIILFGKRVSGIVYHASTFYIVQDFTANNAGAAGTFQIGEIRDGNQRNISAQFNQGIHYPIDDINVLKQEVSRVTGIPTQGIDLVFD